MQPAEGLITGIESPYDCEVPRGEHTIFPEDLGNTDEQRMKERLTLRAQPVNLSSPVDSRRQVNLNYGRRE